MSKTVLKNHKIKILYKEDCGFCVACKEFSEKRNKKNNLEFIDIYSKKASKLFTEHSLKKDFSTIWLFANTTIHSKSKAIFIITQNLTIFWKILSYGYFLLPKKWWDAIYAFISKKVNSNKVCKK